MNIQSSSSSFTCEWTYDVFLNFRGEDTRMGFTGNLYHALDEKGIHTFIDNRLERGQEITPTLLKAIEESRIAIVIFSMNYAFSTFCLEELVKILECLKQKGRLVWPVFYQVDPSDVRHLRKNYGVAIAKHEEKFQDNKKVQKWKLALHEAANLSGWHFEHGYDYEYKFIGKIVAEVSKRISRIPLYVADYPVGLDSRVREVLSLLKLDLSEEIIIVGIHGIGGIGKSTIARAVHNVIVDQFEGSCFLFDIGENSIKHGLPQLQETLLNEIFGEKEIKVRHVSIGIPIIKKKLHRKKVLLILDDINSLEQLRALAGGFDWFGFGSRIIITTRDEHLLDIHNVTRKYEALNLRLKEALELFSWNAFRGNEVDQEYANLSNQAAYYCNGLPLALEIIGSNLFDKSPREWKSALEIYEGIPDSNVQKILEASYNDLEEIEKEIFLDVTCFFKGYHLKDITNIISRCRHFNPQYAIRKLKKRSLLKFIDGYIVTMHNLVQHMGREIVRRQSPSKPGKRNRLWCHTDILYVLEENLGSEDIEALQLHLPPGKKVRWDGKAFEKMRNLKMLIIRNAEFSCEPKHLPSSLRMLDWEKYPSPSLPADFHPINLCILNLNASFITLDKPFKNFESLSEMVMSNCQFLKHVPDVSGAPNLRKIEVTGCKNLVEVHNSVGLLQKLCLLDAKGCTELRIFPQDIYSTSIEFLNLSECLRLESFPKMSGIIKDTTYVRLQNSEAEEPQTLVVEQFCGILSLKCSSLTFPKLENWHNAIQNHPNCIAGDEERVGSRISFFVEICDCKLETSDFLSGRLPLFLNLISLNLSNSDFTELPTCINQCHYLHTLILDDCIQLRYIREIQPSIKTLSARGCKLLSYVSICRLINPKLHEVGGTHFTVPRLAIPGWFRHCSGRKISLWFRNKFPMIALCLVYTASPQHVNIHINGTFVANIPVRSLANHISLFDLECRHKWPGRDRVVYKKDAWNHVEISSESDYRYPEVFKMDPDCWIGVYVYNKEENVGADVRFSDPSPLKTNSDSNRDLVRTISNTICCCHLCVGVVYEMCFCHQCVGADAKLDLGSDGGFRVFHSREAFKEARS